jgi:hypothetical protein
MDGAWTAQWLHSHSNILKFCLCFCLLNLK